jgi:UDP-glucuronate 4-epimerase
MYEAFITGITGFVGFHLATRLAKMGFVVHGTDAGTPSSEGALRSERKKALIDMGISIHAVDTQNLETLASLFIQKKFSHFFHLAARERLREEGFSDGSLASQDLVGFIKVMEFAKQFHPMKVIFASSSEVYGLNHSPLKESDPATSPINLFGATKASSELIAHSYHHLYGMDITGLRFFALYGPYGRPHMQYFLFTKAILEKTPITLFKYRDQTRDFIYIDDAIEGIIESMPLSGFQLINIGSGKKERVSTLIELIENHVGSRTEIISKETPTEEVVQGEADLTKAKLLLNFSPKVSLEQGLEKFVDWHKTFKNFP